MDNRYSSALYGASGLYEEDESPYFESRKPSLLPSCILVYEYAHFPVTSPRRRIQFLRDVEGYSFYLSRRLQQHICYCEGFWGST